MTAPPRRRFFRKRLSRSLTSETRCGGFLFVQKRGLFISEKQLALDQPALMNQNDKMDHYESWPK
jgi:hypothetical protein